MKSITIALPVSTTPVNLCIKIGFKDSERKKRNEKFFFENAIPDSNGYISVVRNTSLLMYV